MEEDKTVIITPRPITVILKNDTSSKDKQVYTNTFEIGRSKDCDVIVENELVSRVHVKIELEGIRWYIQDAGSTNGTFLNGRRIEREELPEKAEIELGIGGPHVELIVGEGDGTTGDVYDGFQEQEKDYSVTGFLKHLKDTNIGQYSMIFRRAMEREKGKLSKIYFIIIGIIVCFLIISGIIVSFQRAKIKKMYDLAEGIFYNMKSLELQITQHEQILHKAGDIDLQNELEEMQSKHIVMEKQYDQFLDQLETYEKGMDETERIILKMARIFGECEINIPAGFIDSVKYYIRLWQSTSRLERAIRRAEKNNYMPLIVKELNKYYLPEQFFYLALQESDFRVTRCGPKTRYGIAKGVWQFVPPTAKVYGLRIGRLWHLRKYDGNDDRCNFNKSTAAAAQYLSYIYTTEAQASGLLVAASYNWGETNVRRLIRRLPENPQERNFWKLFNKYRIPKETRTYVFYIFSAAVIGANPRLFGFDFDNPLADVE